MVCTFECKNIYELQECVKIIDSGGIVIYPTDTVFGIGCDPTIDNSVLRLYAIKNRPMEKSLPILACDVEEVSRIAIISPQARALIEYYWPGPLTIVLRLKENSGISEHVFKSNANSIALRIPNNQCILDLLGMTRNRMIVGTSANLSKRPSTTNFEDIDKELLLKCDAIIHNNSFNNLLGESTIVDLSTDGPPKILREGSISKKKILSTMENI